MVSEPSTVEVRVHRLRHHTTERDFNTAIPAPVSPIRIPAHAVDSLYYTKVYSHLCGLWRHVPMRILLPASDVDDGFFKLTSNRAVHSVLK